MCGADWTIFVCLTAACSFLRWPRWKCGVGRRWRELVEAIDVGCETRKVGNINHTFHILQH